MSGSPSIRIDVEHGGGSYPILIEPGLYSAAAEHLAPFAQANGGKGKRRFVIVTDKNVWAAQGPRLKIGLAGSGIELREIVLAPGEQTKSWPVLTRLVDRLLALNVERSDTILAFGGGVVGDLAGFAASILKRGCKVVQIPTSLLAQVDSSVGGKTGINTRFGKNLVGTFHHPGAVLIDPRALETLPKRQTQAGFAEVIKMGAIGDKDFFAWCEQNGPAVIAGNEAAGLHAIATSIAAKARIVAEDEREVHGWRQLLNLGHTFGHALEAETGLGGSKPNNKRSEGSQKTSNEEWLLHGEAVAIGMNLAFTLSNELGLCGKEDADRLGRLLKSVGLPTDLHGLDLQTTGAKLVQHMAHDKKAKDNKLPLILAKGIGRAYADDSVAPQILAAFLDDRLTRKSA
jgi:3-dehydroquinate synthase